MPAWGDYVDKLEKLQPQEWQDFLYAELETNLNKIAKTLNCPNVILYASAFLQKPQLPFDNIALTAEDINGFMNVIYGMSVNEKIILLLHTPGGDIHAADTIIDYIHQKFKKLITIVPVYALSAGTIICLSSDELILGRQSQLSPTDPQLLNLPTNRSISALSIIEQFEQAKKDIRQNPDAARAWYPILQTLGYGLIEEASRAIDYSKEIIKKWLNLKNIKNPDNIVSFFCEKHESHGKRINKEDLKKLGLNVQDLESNQELQDAVLSVYHLFTIMAERGSMVKIIASSHKRYWIKNISFISMSMINPVINPQHDLLKFKHDK